MLRPMSERPEPTDPSTTSEPPIDPARARRNALFIALAGVMLIITLSGLMALLLEAVPPVAGPDGSAPAEAPPGE